MLTLRRVPKERWVLEQEPLKGKSRLYKSGFYLRWMFLRAYDEIRHRPIHIELTMEQSDSWPAMQAKLQIGITDDLGLLTDSVNALGGRRILEPESMVALLGPRIEKELRDILSDMPASHGSSSQQFSEGSSGEPDVELGRSLVERLKDQLMGFVLLDAEIR